MLNAIGTHVLVRQQTMFFILQIRDNCSFVAVCESVLMFFTIMLSKTTVCKIVAVWMSETLIVVNESIW